MKSNHPHYETLMMEKLSAEINMNWLRLMNIISSGSILE